MYFKTGFKKKPQPYYEDHLQFPSKYANYTDYQYFTLPINLYPIVANLKGENIDIVMEEFFNKDYSSEFKIKILDQDDEPIIVSDAERKEIEKAIAEFMSEPDAPIFLFSYDADFMAKNGRVIPHGWVHSILTDHPFNFPIMYRREGMYIPLHRYKKKDFTAMYSDFQEKLVDWVRSMYEIGVLPSVLTVDFIEDWNLEPYKMFYKPKTVSRMVMGDDPVVFLLEHIQVNGREGYTWTTDTLEKPEVMVSILQTESREFVMEQDRFHIAVENYKDVKHLVLEYMKRFEDEVDCTFPIESPFRKELTL